MVDEERKRREEVKSRMVRSGGICRRPARRSSSLGLLIRDRGLALYGNLGSELVTWDGILVGRILISSERRCKFILQQVSHLPNGSALTFPYSK